MKTRKIIQITHSGNYLYALCDDGSVWVRYTKGWEHIENIPQG